MPVLALAPKTQPLDEGIAQQLRDLAARIDAGEIECVVVGYTTADSHKYLFPGPLCSSLLLTDLMHNRAMERYRRNGE